MQGIATELVTYPAVSSHQRRALIDALGQVIRDAQELRMVLRRAPWLADEATNALVDLDALRRWQRAVAIGGPREPVLCLCADHSDPSHVVSPDCPRCSHDTTN